MWKKVLGIGVALSMMFSLTACGGPGVEAVYREASDKAQTMTSQDVTMDMEMSMTSDDEELNTQLTMNSNIKIQDANEETMKMEMPATIKAQGQTIDMNTYYTDGYYYMELAGTKLKYEMDIIEIQKQVASSTGLSNLSVDAFEELSMREEDGNKVISFVADGSKMTEYLESVTNSAQGLSGAADTDMEISSAKGEFTVNKDGYFIEQDVQVSYSMEVEGKDVNVDLSVACKYNHVGEDITVELPDLSNYNEIDPSILNQAS